MTVLFGGDAWITLIASRLIDRITAASVLPPDAVFPFAGEILDLIGGKGSPPAERFACAWPMAMPVDPSIVAGGGAEYTAFDATWRVDIACRLGNERNLRDVRTLTDNSKGLAALVEKVCIALQLEDLAPPAIGTDDRWSPLLEPMRLLRLEWNPRVPPVGWSWCRSVWDVKHRTDLRRS